MSYKEIIELHGPKMEQISISRLQNLLFSDCEENREKMFGAYLHILSGEKCISASEWMRIPKSEKSKLKCFRFGNFGMIQLMERHEKLSQIPDNSFGIGIITIQKPDGGFLEYQVDNLWYLRSVIAGCEFMNVVQRAFSNAFSRFITGLDNVVKRTTINYRSLLLMGLVKQSYEDKEKFLEQFSGAQIVRDVCSAYLDRRMVAMNESFICPGQGPLGHQILIHRSHAFNRTAILRANGEEYP